MERNAPVAPEFVPVSEETRLKIWELAKQALPVTCYADLFGKPQMVRWTVDRVMERLAAGEGGAATLEVLVAEERRRCPGSWSGGKPAFCTGGSVRNGTFIPPTRPHDYWSFIPLYKFVQSQESEWRYCQRTEEILDAGLSWTVEYVRYDG